MPSIESSTMDSRKQDESCGIGEHALKSVGEAWVNLFEAEEREPGVSVSGKPRSKSQTTERAARETRVSEAL